MIILSYLLKFFCLIKSTLLSFIFFFSAFRVGWTVQQKRLYNKVMKALHVDRLARLAFDGVSLLLWVYHPKLNFKQFILHLNICIPIFFCPLSRIVRNEISYLFLITEVCSSANTT